SERSCKLGEGRPQRDVPLRLRQEIQALPRTFRLRLTTDDKSLTAGQLSVLCQLRFFQAPKRVSKPFEGIVGAAPLVTLGGVRLGRRCYGLRLRLRLGFARFRLVRFGFGPRAGALGRL